MFFLPPLQGRNYVLLSFPSQEQKVIVCEPAQAIKAAAYQSVRRQTKARGGTNFPRHEATPLHLGKPRCLSSFEKADVRSTSRKRSMLRAMGVRQVALRINFVR
jgi:hypothetical protein